MYKFKPLYVLGIAGCILIVNSVPASSRELSSENRNLEVDITRGTGHLFDWSQTDRRIKSIMIDNPEISTKSILFNANGCTVKACSNSSMLLVSSRAAAQVGFRGTIRVIATDRNNRLYPYTITIKVTKLPQQQHETKFYSNQYASPSIPTVRSAGDSVNSGSLSPVPVNFRNVQLYQK
jgi:hypothetical protein